MAGREISRPLQQSIGRYMHQIACSRQHQLISELESTKAASIPSTAAQEVSMRYSCYSLKQKYLLFACTFKPPHVCPCRTILQRWRLATMRRCTSSGTLQPVALMREGNRLDKLVHTWPTCFLCVFRLCTISQLSQLKATQVLSCMYHLISDSNAWLCWA